MPHATGLRHGGSGSGVPLSVGALEFGFEGKGGGLGVRMPDEGPLTCLFWPPSTPACMTLHLGAMTDGRAWTEKRETDRTVTVMFACRGAF